MALIAVVLMAGGSVDGQSNSDQLIAGGKVTVIDRTNKAIDADDPVAFGKREFFKAVKGWRDGATLHYRHTDMTEGAFRATEMQWNGDSFSAAIPAEYLTPEQDIMVYFSGHNSDSQTLLYPGIFSPDFAAPYFVVEIEEYEPPGYFTIGPKDPARLNHCSNREYVRVGLAEVAKNAGPESFMNDKAGRPFVLNIRGGAGTGGFTFGMNDEQLSSFHDSSGRFGWGEFAGLLQQEGFDVLEIEEGKHIEGCEVHESESCSEPVDFANMDLSQYSIIIMGSNNSRYDELAVDALMNYVKNGGGLIFISDANFGRNWRDAPLSDQVFLDRFGLRVNQDNGIYSFCRNPDGKESDFLIPGHPLLKGVDEFDGEGISPISFEREVDGVKTQLIVKAKGQVRRNLQPDGSSLTNDNRGIGPLTNAEKNDASLITAEYGKGRVVFFCDRNTFFNIDGGGTSLHRFDNKALCLNIINWVQRNMPPAHQK